MFNENINDLLKKRSLCNSISLKISKISEIRRLYKFVLDKSQNSH
jgi:hypothetical protein